MIAEVFLIYKLAGTEKLEAFLKCDRVRDNRDKFVVCFDFDYTLYGGDALRDLLILRMGRISFALLRYLSIALYKVRLKKCWNDVLLAVTERLLEKKPLSQIEVEALSKRICNETVAIVKKSGIDFYVCTGNVDLLVSALLPKVRSFCSGKGENLRAQKYRFLDSTKRNIVVSDNLEDLGLVKDPSVEAYFVVFEGEVLGRIL